MAAVQLRQGTIDDVPRLVELMYAEPLREAVVLAGGEQRARRFQREVFVRALARPSNELLVAEADGGPAIGFALLGDGGDVPPLRELIGMSVRAMGLTGALRAGWRSTARMRVDFSAPPGGPHLVELHVDPTRRGQGIGGTLLDEVGRRCRARGVPHLSLTTTIDNPARRLYERHGFVIEGERRSARYQRFTGVPGRVLMVKHLDAPS